GPAAQDQHHLGSGNGKRETGKGIERPGRISGDRVVFRFPVPVFRDMSTSSTEILQQRPRRSGLLLVCVLAFCVLRLSAQAPGAAKGHRSLLQSWILSASAPVSQLVSSVSRAVWGFADRTAEAFTARDENSRLKGELARSNQELFQLRARIAEEDRLKVLLSAGAALPAVRVAAPGLLLESRARGQSAWIGAGSSPRVLPGPPPAGPPGLPRRVLA